MDRTFGLNYSTMYRDIKGNVVFVFKEREVSLRYRSDWTWTWPQLVSLILEQLKGEN